MLIYSRVNQTPLQLQVRNVVGDSYKLLPAMMHYLYGGTLAMMGRDRCLRTAATTGLSFIPGWFAMWTMDDDMDWG
jgi:hypothetical protein